MLYGGIMERKKNLVLATVAAALVVFGGAVFYEAGQKQIPFQVAGAGTLLSMGQRSSFVEIVLIEDFQCRNCMAFSHQVIPKIQMEYIRTGKARFTLVPVSFLAGSQGIANAVMEVYNQAPDRFFSYLEAVLEQYQDSEIKTADLIRLARRTGGIDLAKLQLAIERGSHNQALEKNLSWARGMMGGRFKTPALYINGAPGSTFSFEAIQYQIDQIIGKR